MKTIATIAAVALLATGAFAQRQQVPPEHAPYVHGHLVGVPYIIDKDGIRWSSDRFAFLAINIGAAPETPRVIEYAQELPYLAGNGLYFPSGVLIERSAFTSEADEDGWLLLRIDRACVPGQRIATVGLITVCEPVPFDAPTNMMCRSATSGVGALYYGAPLETVTCSYKRRAVRK